MASAPDQFPTKSTTPELALHVVKFVGGTNAVTKVYGEGVTCTYISAGIVDLTWSRTSAPGECMGVVGHCYSATTTADVKAYLLAHGVYNTTTRTLRLNLTETTTLTNLAALEWLAVTVAFTRAD